MREHVVQFAGDAAALGERGRGCLARTCVLELGQEQFGANLALPAARRFPVLARSRPAGQVPSSSLAWTSSSSLPAASGGIIQPPS